MTESQVLKRLQFPAYCIRVLDNGLVAIAGGGGTSKTGVGNSIELGTVDYAKNDLKNKNAPSNERAQFHSIHTFEPDDAIMKFISFTVDRFSASKNGLKSNKPKNGLVKKKSNGLQEALSKIEFDSNKSDLYIAASVNNTIEIYKVQPIIDKHDTNLKTKRNRTNSQSNQQHARQRMNSTRNSFSSTKKDGIQATNLEASANLMLQKSIHINDIMDEDNNKNNINKNEINETIDTLALCQVEKKVKNTLFNNQILLCSGSSKGNIYIMELTIDNEKNDRVNDSNNNKNSVILEDEISVKCKQLKVFKQAHGENEVDELQVNNQQNHLLSIGKDNRCFIWSLSNKIEKISELDYISLLKDKNLRMKHSRFAKIGYCLYTTYIPRIRGGGRDMSTYIHRWDTSHASNYKVIKAHRVKNTILTSIQSSKDGECLCCGDYEGQIYLFDANFNKLANFKKQHTSVVTDLAFYHDSTLDFNSNKLILSLSIDRTLQCYTYLDTRVKKKSLLSTQSSPIDSMLMLTKELLNKLNIFSMSTFVLVLAICASFLYLSYFYFTFEH